jgi:4'-phosphopantetheinyl transferase
MSTAMIDSPLQESVAPEVTLDLWRIPLDLPGPDLTQLRINLSLGERERAASFRFRRDADRFTAGRGQLRRILGRLAGVDPAALRFAYGPAGKPFLEEVTGLGFNLAHSGAQGLLAVAGVEVGVDLESSPAPPGACEEIAPAYFAAEEMRALETLPRGEREQAFLRCWTRKEAYVKALGDGLQVPLDAFSVSLRRGEPARLRSSRLPGELERWSLVDLSHLTPGATAAACVEGSIAAIRPHRQEQW